MNISDQKYCFWDAKSLEDTCTLICLAGVASAVLVISCYRLIRFRNLSYESKDRHLKICSQLHVLTALWGLMFLIEQFYSIYSFFEDLNTDPVPSDVVSYSKILAILDKIPVFVVQTIFLKICIFNYNGLLGTIQVKFFTVNHKFYKYYIHYIFKGRLLLQGLGLVSLLIFDNDSQIWTTSAINVIFQVIDSIVICGVLIYSLMAFVREGIDRNKIDRRVKDQIKREYGMMIVSEIAGVIVNLTFLVFFPYMTTRLAVSCMQPVTHHWDFFFGHNILGNIALHLMPVIWFLKMYNYKGAKISLEQILSESYSRQFLNESYTQTGNSTLSSENHPELI